jgi:hypothetical protein
MPYKLGDFILKKAPETSAQTDGGVWLRVFKRRSRSPFLLRNIAKPSMF